MVATRPFEVGAGVRDLESMERSCRDIIGCRVERPSRVPESIGGPAGLGGELVAGWPRVHSGGCVKLILPRSGVVSVGVVPLAAWRSGLSYLAFHVDDLDPVVEALPAAGARRLSGPVVVLARGRRIGFRSDPEGGVVELTDVCGGNPTPRHSN